MALHCIPIDAPATLDMLSDSYFNRSEYLNDELVDESVTPRRVT
jgi:hypothetical protein